MKKKWNKPIVTVLVRTRPEESIMSACKIAEATVGAVPPDCAGGLGDCVDIASS